MSKLTVVATTWSTTFVRTLTSIYQGAWQEDLRKRYKGMRQLVCQPCHASSMLADFCLYLKRLMASEGGVVHGNLVLVVLAPVPEHIAVGARCHGWPGGRVSGQQGRCLTRLLMKAFIIHKRAKATGIVSAKQLWSVCASWALRVQPGLQGSCPCLRVPAQLRARMRRLTSGLRPGWKGLRAAYSPYFAPGVWSAPPCP